MNGTIAEVRQAFEDERTEMEALDQKLAAERREIKLKAFTENRALTAEEVDRLRTIGATRAEFADALEELTLETLDALDNTTDLDALLQKIAMINDGLRDDLEGLKAIEHYAQLAEKVLAGLANVATKLAELRPSLV